MRLYKKAAAVLLAAAMAVSMMTACGGGAGGGSGAVSGVTYTSDAALAAGVDADSTTLEKVISQSESRYLKLSSDLAWIRFMSTLFRQAYPMGFCRDRATA